MTTTWRGQDIELQRRFIRAVADKFAVRLNQLSVIRRCAPLPSRTGSLSDEQRSAETSPTGEQRASADTVRRTYSIRECRCGA